MVNKNLPESLLIDSRYDRDLDIVNSWLQLSKNRHIITLDHDFYPPQLARLPIPPLLLFAEGNISLLKNKLFAIVGTRSPSSQGLDHAQSFAKEIADHGYTIVSGLAEGIDAAAHSGALKTTTSTIAVLGNGINKCYPTINYKLQNQIKEDGLLLSPFMLNTQPRSFHFPNRNKIIVGLSQGCLVVESKLHGGSMISANFAADMGIEVFAIPSSIHNIKAQGCHHLIKTGAKLVEQVQDIFEEIPQSSTNSPDLPDLSIQEQQIFSILDFNPLSIEAICRQSAMNLSDVCDILLSLELKNLITNNADGYRKIL